MSKIPEADPRELAQCAAFAYFMKYQTRNETHEEKFYFLFRNHETASDNAKAIREFNQLKNSRLSPNFSIDKVRSKYGDTVDNIKVVYHLTKKLLDENKIPQLRNYIFLDQSDPFVNFIKMTCLTNIKQAFGFQFRTDQLSPVDVIFVKKDKLNVILQDFETNFSSKETIINNNLVAGNYYAELTQKYIDNYWWYPISLKLPSEIKVENLVAKIKLVSFKKPKNSVVEIDPYIKFISLLIEHPEHADKNISNLVKINFDEFNISDDVQQWTFPIDLNYKDIIDPETKQKIENYNLSFQLMAMNSGGWNGQWTSKSRSHQNVAGHLGGMSLSTFDYYSKKFKKYHAVLDLVKKERVQELNKFLLTYDKKYARDTRYRFLKTKLLTELNAHKLVGKGKTEEPNLRAFFSYLEEKEDLPDDTLSLEYKLNFINRIKRLLGQQYVNRNQTRNIELHYTHAQISAFLFKGGKELELHFKKIFVFALFGLLTKSSHKIFGMDDTKTMKSILTKEIEVNRRKILATFTTPPHYIIS